jgi:hypothetical protein
MRPVSIVVTFGHDSSRIPARMVFRDMPVASATALIPPRPNDKTTTAPQCRRQRSLSAESKARNFPRIHVVIAASGIPLLCQINTIRPIVLGYFILAQLLSLVELGTHVEVALVVKPCCSGEYAMVDGLLRHLTPEMLLLWDRGFFSYEEWRKLERRGVKVLAWVTSRLILRPLRTLADGSYLAKIYRSEYHRRKDRDGITV